MILSISTATAADAAAITLLRNQVAAHLCKEFGPGHWSHSVGEGSVVRSINTSRVLVARVDGEIIATLRLATKKPWAIDTAYFTPATRPLYLVDMAVMPRVQRQGIGRRFMVEAQGIVWSWPADAIRLDAYDAPAGAAGFYEKCGYIEKGRVTYRNVPLVYFELVRPT